MSKSHAGHSCGIGGGARYRHQTRPHEPVVRRKRTEASREQPASEALGRGTESPGSNITTPDGVNDKEAAAKAFALVAQHWRLSDEEAAALLSVDPPTWRGWKQALTPSTHGKCTGMSVDATAPTRPNALVTKPSLPSESAAESVERRPTTDATGALITAEPFSRMCICYFIDASLRRLYRKREVASRWVRCENSDPVFGGKAPIQLMIDGGLPSIRDTRDYLIGVMGR